MGTSSLALSALALAALFACLLTDLWLFSTRRALTLAKQRKRRAGLQSGSDSSPWSGSHAPSEKVSAKPDAPPESGRRARRSTARPRS